MRPPIVVFPHSLSSYGPVPPIGLAYVAAVLRELGHDVSVVDGSGSAIDQWEDFETPVGMLRRVGLSPEEIVDQLPADAEVIGITHMFLHEWPQVRAIAEAARGRFPNALIVLGGENATAFHPWIFEETDAVDACVLGEGEAVVAELACRVAEGRPLDGMDGLALRTPSGVVDPGLSPRMRKLSEIPRPAWDLIPLQQYWKYSDFFGIHRGRSMPMLATRGCPYKCSFCSSPQMWTTRYVVRDPEDVVDEIEHYVHEHGIESVNFVDLTAVTKRQWTLNFCDALQRRGLDIEWQVPVGTRVEALDREVLQKLYDTGCRYITFAPESGSKRMLEIYDKRVDVTKIHTALKAAHEIGIRSRINIIIGHPQERWSDQWHSLKFLVKAALHGGDDAAVIMFCPYPGSRDFKDLVDAGYVIDEAAYYVGISRTSSGHVSHNPRMSSRKLRVVQMAMVMIFYGLGLVSHPKRIGEYIQAQRTGRENTFFDQLIRIKMRGFKPNRAAREVQDAPRTPSRV
ncbi:MAG: B12-binding domain-containing radical SAM protein [Aquihabitans sp.]